MNPAMRRGGIGVWWRAVRAYSFPASVAPVLVGAALALESGNALWGLLPVVLLCSVLFQAGTNAINDYFDFVRGVDEDDPYSGSSGVLTKGLLRPSEVFVYGVGLFGAGTLLGIVLLYYRGLPMLLIGVAGLLGGYLYTGGPKGYKYLALGEVLVFVLMGPLSVVGTYLALTGEVSLAVLLASLPVGSLVAAIMAINNHRDAASDRGVGVKTLSNVIGFRASRVENLILPVSAYLFVALAALFGLLSMWTLLVFLSLPLALRNLRDIWISGEESVRELTYLVVRTAQLHLLFGILLSVGITLGVLTT
ncbi:MAG: 1,4-dihydroxy-2-naphthoate polyprenyltransferase [uncultured Rubrobacteraceae bacterium]|uniref:1,4-dihydroxy-2-naphthoate octaprenyltransferase n=1 Tax=uncultured Rubrobacteraceae bacterium TaxID=349277 RepID=A0A6J4QGM0_9ACTN|nr:MAG: 1,4-dihydroxy-2-naphthoate polyprenyltransferase [uncultured Rubrobacteraceae bacterium]